MKAVIVTDDTSAGGVGTAPERSVHIHVPTGRRLLVGDDVAAEAGRYGLVVVDVEEIDLAPFDATRVPQSDQDSEATVSPELSDVDQRAESIVTVESISEGSDAVGLSDETDLDNMTMEEESVKREDAENETPQQEAREQSEAAA